MANYKVKEFKFYLSKDKKFMEKLNQCQDDLKAGRVGFFVSMQTLIGYTSFKFLSSLIIEDKDLKSKFFKMNSMTGDINSLEALKLLCRVLNRMDLFNLIEETGLNDYANVDKHSKIYVPFDGDVANNSASAFNQFINSLMSINRFVDANNCKIKFFYKDNNVKVVEKIIEKPVIKEVKPVDEKAERKAKFEKLIKNEHYIASKDFYLGNSKWEIRILDVNYESFNNRKGIFDKLLNTYKGTCKRSCVIRLTLLDRNEEIKRQMNINVTMLRYNYEQKYKDYDDTTCYREYTVGGDNKTFIFREEYQSERFSLFDERNDLLGKPDGKIMQFRIENSAIGEKFNFTYNIKKDLFIFD